jgi:hypothetical protein
MLTVLTWFWYQPGGRATYTAEHVNIWAAMVRRHLTLPHRIACVTDIPAGINSDITIIRPPGEFVGIRTPRWNGGKPDCFRRLAMYRPDAASIFGERFVNMDLDCIIGGSLDPLFDRPEDLVLFSGTSPRRPYNGSMTLMTAGCRSHVYTDFTPEGALAASEEFVGSDQAWTCYKLGPGEATWGPEDNVWWYGVNYRANLPKPAILFFPGSTKPWSIPPGEKNRWIAKHYRLESPRDNQLPDRIAEVKSPRKSVPQV